VTIVLVVLEQLFPSVILYVMVVEPLVKPVTCPTLLIVATVGVALLQVPPVVVLLNVVEVFGQSVVLPVIELTVGRALTVKLVALLAVPLGVITLMFHVLAPLGKTAVICVLLFTVNVAAIPLNVTLVAPVKLVPVIVTVVPELTQALLGVKLVIVGTGLV